MIAVTRLDGETVYINERNIQWVEKLPDTAITFLGGARLLVREPLESLMARISDHKDGATVAPSPSPRREPPADANSYPERTLD